MSREKLYSDIGKRIKTVRIAENLTQKVFAGLLGITQSWLSEIESGVKLPADVLLTAIQYRYKINKDWLLTGLGEMYRVGLGESEIEVYNSEEKELCKKLLRIIRTKQDTTVMAIRQNIEAFLTTPDSEREKEIEFPKKKIAAS